MADNIALQQIANDISRTFKQLTDTQREIREAIINMNGGVDKKRSKPGESPTSTMNITRRLNSSFKHLNSTVDDTTQQLGLFGRYLRGANKRLSKLEGNSNGANNTPNAAALIAASNASNSQLAQQLQQLIQQLQQNSNNNNPNNPNTPNDPPEPPENRMLSTLTRWLSGFSIVSGLKKGYGELTTAASRGGIYDFSTQTDAIMMGMDGQELVELQANYRTSIMRATDGIDHWTESVRAAQSDLLPFTGTLKDAAAVTASLQNNLLNIGFSFDEANKVIGNSRVGLISNFKDLSAITGKTILEISDAMNNIVASDNGREVLRKIDKSQRADYVQTQAQLLKQYTQLTGSLDRASEIINDQMQRTKIDPKTRYVQSVKAMQAAVHSGMGYGDAKRLQQLTAMNPRMLMQDPKLNMEFTKLRGQLHQNIKEMQGSSNFNTEWFGFFLEDMAGVAGMEAANTELDTPLKDTNIQQQQERNISAVLDGNSLAKETLTWIQRIEASVRSMLGLMVLGTAGAILSNLDKLKSIPLLGRGGTIPPTPGTPPITPTALSATMMKFAKAGGVGIASAGLAILADKMIKPETQIEEAKKNVTVSAIEWAGVGATIGTFIAPGIGTAVGAALGGVAGAIIGSLQETKDQQYYTNIGAKDRFNADLQILSTKHNVEMGQLDDQIRKERELSEQKTGNERLIHLQRIKDLEDQKKQQSELFNIQVSEAKQLVDMAMNLMNKTTEADKVKVALDDSFERGINLNKQFDVSEFLEQSGMSSQQLFASILTHVKDVSTEQSRSLLKSINEKQDIRGADNLRILNEWAAKYQEQLASEVVKITDDTEKLRSKTHETINKTSGNESLFAPYTPPVQMQSTVVPTNMGFGGMPMALPSTDMFNKPIRPIDDVSIKSNVLTSENSGLTVENKTNTLLVDPAKEATDPMIQIMKDQKSSIDLLITTITQQHKENRDLTIRLEEQRRFNDEFGGDSSIPPLLRRTTGHVR